MIFFFGTGKINTKSKYRGSGNFSFNFQSSGQEFRVTTSGINQSDIVANLRPGESVYILGYPEKRGKHTIIRPRILLPISQADPTAMGALFNQILEAHTTR